MPRPSLAAALLAVVLPSAALAQSPAPRLPDLFTPAPRASVPALPEIGRTRTSFCSAVAASSAKAAHTIVQNDQLLDALKTDAPRVDFDGMARPRREAALAKVRQTATDVRTGSADALGETARIRAYAATLRDPVKRLNMLAYADGLDEALHQQQTAGVDIMRAMVIAEGRRQAAEVRLQLQVDNARPGQSLEVDDPGSWHSTMQAIAERLDEHAQTIDRAEKAAAKRAGAMGC
jgi:hypothetical protein